MVVPLHKASRGSIMRIWLPPLLFLLSAVCVVTAQPPASPPGPEKFVIKPGGKGVVPVESADRDPAEKPGFLIIRPNGKGAIGRGDDPLPQSTTRTISTSPLSGSMSVPPPGPQPKEMPDGKPIFDYWFAVGVEGQRVGYVNWAAKEVEQKGKHFAVGVRYLNLTVSRFGNTVTQWGEESSVESTAGDVFLTSMRQGLGKDQALALTGVVNTRRRRSRSRARALRRPRAIHPGRVAWSAWSASRSCSRS